ncbi:MAG: UDP-3-O-(3-hydroxymyristoyl)glucosamine N-acyltransferase, partial [Muribaculaceae bacterium]|nr:UDP-3-O-(3-hydroxymyristoyl)glucosamine N-acyltransferase [Muribaculaceae bacterium]
QVGLAGHLTGGDNVQLGAQAGVPNSIPAGKRMMGTPAIPAGNFARMVVAQKNLPDLMQRIRQLEQQVARLSAAE